MILLTLTTIIVGVLIGIIVTKLYLDRQYKKTLDGRLAEVKRDAMKEAIVLPNKMISCLLRQITGRDKTLMEAYREAQMALREEVRNGR